MTNRHHAGKLKPLSIYLGDLTYTTLSLATDAFPLNIGFVGAYAKKVFGDEVDIQLFKYVEDLEQAIHDAPPGHPGLKQFPVNFRSRLGVLGIVSQTFAPHHSCEGRP